jgi:orotate phosphoribosyltransferase
MKKIIAKKLLQLGCVKFSPDVPFVYASGLTGPIYCDNRMSLSHVSFRDLIIESFIQIIEKEKCHYDLMGGIATAGIPYAAIVADRLKKPMVYIRPKAKGHGKKNQVEGDFNHGQSVLLFEDLINQGSSVLEAFAGLKEVGLKASTCLAIVDYQMPAAEEKLNAAEIQLLSLTNFSSLVETAIELELITKDNMTELYKWHQGVKNGTQGNTQK